MEIGDRLSLAMKAKGLSNNKLATITGVHASTIKNWLDNITTPDNLKLEKASNVLEVNFEWLKNGVGEMKSLQKEIDYPTNTSTLVVNEPEEHLTNKNGNVFVPQKGGKYKIYVKKVPVKAFGSYLSEGNDSEFFNELEQVSFTVEHLGRGNYICFEVQGESMNGGGLYDAPEGAELLCRELGRQHWKDGFRDSVYGWVIVHKDTVLYKDIIDFNNDTGDILCHSRSGLPQHPDFTINLNDVKQIWKVIKRSF